MKGYNDLSEWVVDLIHLIYHLEMAATAENKRDGSSHNTEGISDHLAEGAGDITDDILALIGEIYERREKESASTILIPSLAVSQSYHLDRLEYALVLLALSMEADTGLCLEYRQRYRRDIPDFQYALHLLSFVLEIGIEITAALCDPSYKLWQLFVPGQQENQELVLQQPLKLRREVVAFLLSGQILLPRTGCHDLNVSPKAPVLYHDILEQMTLYLGKDGRRILLCGKEGSGKRTLAAQIGLKENYSCILVDVEQIWAEERSGKEAFWGGIAFAARITPCILVFSIRDVPQEKGLQKRLGELLERWFAGQRMILLADNYREKELLYSLADMLISLPDCLTLPRKKLLLDHYVKERERQDWQLGLAGRYRLTAKELTARLAKLRTAYDNLAEAGEGVTESAARELWHTIFKESIGTARLGSGVNMPYLLKDFVGTRENRRQLEQIISISNIWREQAEEWNQTGTGIPEGLCILFHGESGTGKTMAASILANELGMMLLRVDLSAIFDKYIGETEKHLEEILNAAQSNNEILFFDEADALFSKRTEISDSHDKYANVSVSFLLQRIEEYSGIIVLATNLMHHFDSAFLRRIRFVIKFQPLMEEQRAGLWKNMCSRLPEGLSLASDITMEELAAAAELSPARIKSCAVTAAMLAASEGARVIDRRHLRDAFLWETQKDNTPVCNFLGPDDIYK